MNLILFNRIFNGEDVTEDYLPACEALLLAIKNTGEPESSQLWENAGFAFLNTPKKEWGNHLINIAQKMDKYKNSKHIKTKKNILKQPSKFQKLLKGLVF